MQFGKPLASATKMSGPYLCDIKIISEIQLAGRLTDRIVSLLSETREGRQHEKSEC